MSCAILEKILYFFFEETIFVMKKKFNHSEYILPVLKLFMFLFWVLETAIFRMYCCPKKEVRKLLSINGSNVVKLQVNLKEFFFEQIWCGTCGTFSYPETQEKKLSLLHSYFNFIFQALQVNKLPTSMFIVYNFFKVILPDSRCTCLISTNKRFITHAR